MLNKVNGVRFKVLCISALISIFVGGIVVLASRKHVSKLVAPKAILQELHPAPAFTFTASRSITPVHGRERLLTTTQQFQRSDGVYRLVQTFYTPDGAAKQTQTYFGFIGLGVVRLDEAHKRLVFTGPLIDDQPADVEKSLRAHELFNRSESVAGVSVVVWRQTGPEKEDLLEEYRAPSLGGLLIKMVKVSAVGRETVEPKEIQMGEPPSNLFSELLSYPIDYSLYEQQIQEKAKKNDPEIGVMMRQLLERMRRAKP